MSYQPTVPAAPVHEPPDDLTLRQSAAYLVTRLRLVVHGVETAVDFVHGVPPSQTSSLDEPIQGLTPPSIADSIELAYSWMADLESAVNKLHKDL